MQKEDFDAPQSEQTLESHHHQHSPEQDNQVVFQGGIAELSDDDEDLEDEEVSVDDY